MIRPTRTTQPYRATGARAPSSILDMMTAGRSQQPQGATLMHAMNQAKRRRTLRPKSSQGSQKRTIPRY